MCESSRIELYSLVVWQTVRKSLFPSKPKELILSNSVKSIASSLFSTASPRGKIMDSSILALVDTIPAWEIAILFIHLWALRYVHPNKTIPQKIVRDAVRSEFRDMLKSIEERCPELVRKIENADLQVIEDAIAENELDKLTEPGKSKNVNNIDKSQL